MIKLLVGLISISAFVACNGNADSNDSKNTDTNVSALNTLSEKEKADGWQLLFDGQTTNGWHKYGGGPAGSAWKVIDGAFYLDTSNKVDGRIVGGVDIATDEEYENFDLKLQWKISKNGNSGIIFNVEEDTSLYKQTYETGPEMQILDNDGHPDGKFIKHHAGDLYDLISSSKESAKPVGEWNDAEIKLVNGNLDFYLNGENIVHTSMWGENWDKLVAESKFKGWKGFAAFKKGKICLQEHECAVWFRNIKIKKL